jgi:hypothetical protein
MLYGDTMHQYNGLKYIAINMVGANNMVGGAAPTTGDNMESLL